MKEKAEAYQSTQKNILPTIKHDDWWKDESPVKII